MSIDPTGMFSDKQYLEARRNGEFEDSIRYQLDEISNRTPKLSKRLGDIYQNILTSREREVFDYLTLYSGNEERTAIEMGIKKSTVQRYRRRIWKHIRDNFDAIKDEINEANETIKESWGECVKNLSQELYDVLIFPQIKN